jgi:hypothetical protein
MGNARKRGEYPWHSKCAPMSFDGKLEKRARAAKFKSVIKRLDVLV